MSTPERIGTRWSRQYLRIILGNKLDVTLTKPEDRYNYKEDYEHFKTTVTYVILSMLVAAYLFPVSENCKRIFFKRQFCLCEAKTRALPFIETGLLFARVLQTYKSVVLYRSDSLVAFEEVQFWPICSIEPSTRSLISQWFGIIVRSQYERQYYASMARGTFIFLSI